MTQTQPTQPVKPVPVQPTEGETRLSLGRSLGPQKAPNQAERDFIKRDYNLQAVVNLPSFYGGQRSTRPAYWQNPQRVARYVNYLRAAPPGYQPPDWLNVADLDLAYRYMQQQNGNRDWTEWQPLAPDDPGAQFLSTLPTPPPEFLWSNEAAYLPDPAEEQAALAQTYDQPGDPFGDWNNLKPWQQFALGMFAPQPGLKNRPDWTRATAAFGQGALAVGGGAAIGFAVGGPIGAAIGGGIALGGTAYQAYTGQSVPIINEMLIAFDLLAIGAERTIGLGKQAGEDGLEQVLQNLPAAWQAADLTYETQQTDLLNAVAWVAGDEMAGPGEVWQIQKGISEPQALEGTRGAAALSELRERAVAGEDWMMLYQDAIDRFGFSGTFNDFIMQSVIDPANLVPFVGGKIGKTLADAGGNTRLAAAFDANLGNPIIDALPLGIQQLAEAVTGQHGSKGLTDAFETYKGMIQTGFFPAGAEVTPASQLSRFEKWAGGLDAEGKIKEMNPVVARSGIAGMVRYLNNLTPESQAHVMVGNLRDHLAVLFDGAETPEQMVNILRTQAAHASNPAAVGQMTNAVMSSPMGVTVAQVLRDVIADGWDQEMLAEWTGGADKRTIIDGIARELNKKEGVKETRASLVQQYKENPAALIARINELTPQAGKAEYLNEIFGVFAGDDPRPFDAAHFQADLINTVFDKLGDALVQRYGIKTENAILRVNNVLKSAQSILLLNMNPSYFINNTVNNMVTRAVVGVFGFMTPRQIDGFLDRFGIRPERLDEGAGQVGDSQRTMKDADRVVSEAARGDDAIARAQKIVSAVSNKLSLFGGASQAMERAESRQATVIGMTRFWDRAWKPGVGFRKMPNALAQALDAQQPGASRAINAAIRAGMSMKEIESALMGEMVSPHISEAVDRAAEQIFPGNPAGRAMLKELGLERALEDALANAVTPEDVAAGFDVVERKVDEFVDAMLARTVVEKAGQVRDQVKAEGWRAALNLFTDMETRWAMGWLKHFEETSEVYNRQYKSAGDKNIAIAQHQMAESKRFKSIQDQELQVYSGIIQAIGLESDDSRQFVNLIAERHQVWNKFWDGWDEKKNGTVIHHDGRHEALRKFFSTKRKDKSEAAYNKAYDEFEDDWNRKYAAAAKQEAEIDARSADVFARIFEKQTGRPAADAKSWRNKVAGIRAGQVDANINFRKSLKGVTGSARRAAWTAFIQKYNAMIADLKIAEVQGANDLAAPTAAAQVATIKQAQAGAATPMTAQAGVQAEAVDPFENGTAPAPETQPGPAGTPEPGPTWTDPEMARAANEAGITEPQHALNAINLYYAQQDPQVQAAQAEADVRSAELKQVRGARKEAERALQQADVKLRAASEEDKAAARGEVQQAEDAARAARQNERDANKAVTQARDAVEAAKRQARKYGKIENVPLDEARAALADRAAAERVKRQAEEAQRAAQAQINSKAITQQAVVAAQAAANVADAYMSRQQVREELQRAFNASDEEIAAVMVLMDMHADTVARRAGKVANEDTRNEWYAKRIARVEGGEGQTQGGELYQTKRGSVEFLPDGRAIIRAMQAPDISTLVHEIGHIFRRDLSGADLDTVARMGGLRNGQQLLDLQQRFERGELTPGTGDYMSYVEAEEKFARMWERYLAEGDAPTPELKGVFAKFTDWMLNIYKRLKRELGRVVGFDQQPEFQSAGMTPSIRDIFDRLLVDEARREMVAEPEPEPAPWVNYVPPKIDWPAAQTDEERASMFAKADTRTRQEKAYTDSNVDRLPVRVGDAMKLAAKNMLIELQNQEGTVLIDGKRVSVLLPWYKEIYDGEDKGQHSSTKKRVLTALEKIVVGTEDPKNRMVSRVKAAILDSTNGGEYADPATMWYMDNRAELFRLTREIIGEPDEAWFTQNFDNADEVRDAYRAWLAEQDVESETPSADERWAAGEALSLDEVQGMDLTAAPAVESEPVTPPTMSEAVDQAAQADYFDAMLEWAMAGRQGEEPTTGLPFAVAEQLKADALLLAGEMPQPLPLAMNTDPGDGLQVVRVHEFEHGDTPIVANVYQDGELVALMPSSEVAAPFETMDGEARLLGLDPEDPQVWVFEQSGEIHLVDPQNVEMPAGMFDAPEGQGSLLTDQQAGWSLTAQKAQAETFSPQQTGGQDALFNRGEYLPPAVEGARVVEGEAGGPLFEGQPTATPAITVKPGRFATTKGKYAAYQGDAILSNWVDTPEQAQAEGERILADREEGARQAAADAQEFQRVMAGSEPITEAFARKQFNHSSITIEQAGTWLRDKIGGTHKAAQAWIKAQGLVWGVDADGRRTADAASVIEAARKHPDMQTRKGPQLFQTQSPTETPAFRAWFGDSKVVEKNGEPMILYHGGQRWDTADLDNGKRGALWLSPEVSAAIGYADQYDPKYTDVKPLYARIEKPLDLRDRETFEKVYGVTMESLDKYGFNDDSKMARYAYGASGEFEMALQYARENGYDGIIHYDTDVYNRGPITSYVVFDNKQIKLAQPYGYETEDYNFYGHTFRKEGNRGTFDPTNPNILYQEQGDVGVDPFVYYRGTTLGGKRKITGVDDWDKRLFVTERPSNAKWYGPNIDRIVLAPDTRILREGTREFNKVFGRYSQKEGNLRYYNRGVLEAERLGYDVVHFSQQTDVGTIIINPDKIIERTQYTGELFQDQDAQPEPAPAPQYAQPIGPVPAEGTPQPDPWGEAIAELNSETVKPLLRQTQANYTESMKARPFKVGSLDAKTQGDLRAYLNQVKEDMRSTKYAALKYGEQARDSALLNYSKRYGMDNVLNLIAPYQFWYTRSMINWARRMIDKPAWFAMYARLLREQEKMERDGMPTRLEGKIRLAAPWLPEWAGGGIWFDPMAKLFPPATFGQPFEQFAKNRNTLNRQAESILQDMAEGEIISADEMQQALTSHSGSAWERALKQAEAESTTDTSPTSLVSMMLAPSMAWTLAANIAGGTPEKISPMPMTRMGQAVRTATQGTALESVGNVVGLLAKPEEMARDAAGLSQFGEWGDYYIDRTLANMAADGVITAQQARQAMIERSGPAFEEANRRTQYEQMLRVPGAATLQQAASGNLAGAAQSLPTILFSSGLFPEGELKLRGIKGEYDKAWKEWGAGNTDAINAFFVKYPEYEARLALYDTPDERLQKFLIGEVWDKYGELPKANRRVVTQTLGKQFEDAFLSSQTRAYDAIDTDTLARWARALGGMAPKTEATTAAQEVQTMDTLWTPQQALVIDGYTKQKAELFPTIYDEQDAYYGEKDKRFPNIADLQAQYQQTKDARYPGIDEVQALYFYYPKGSNERRQVLAQFPDLAQYWDWKDGFNIKYPEVAQYNAWNQKYLAEHPVMGQYWDWKDQYVQNFPEVVPYIEGNDPDWGSPPLSQKEVDGLDPILLRSILAYGSYGAPLSSGASKLLAQAGAARGMTAEEYAQAVLQSLMP